LLFLKKKKEDLSKQKINNTIALKIENNNDVDQFINNLIEKSLDYQSVTLSQKGYLQDQVNSDLFNYLSQRLKDTLNFDNPNFVETEKELSLPETKEEVQLSKHGENLQNQLDNIIKHKSEILKYLEDNDFGKAELYLVGGRTINKDLKEDSDLDIIIKVEKTPFDNKKESENKMIGYFG